MLRTTLKLICNTFYGKALSESEENSLNEIKGNLVDIDISSCYGNGLLKKPN